MLNPVEGELLSIGEDEEVDSGDVLALALDAGLLPVALVPTVIDVVGVMVVEHEVLDDWELCAPLSELAEDVD